VVRAYFLDRRMIVKLLLLIAAFFVAALAYNFPNYPATLKGWLVLVFVGGPLYLLGEAFFGRIFSKEMGERISKRPALRITALLLVMVIFLAAWIVIGSYFALF